MIKEKSFQLWIDEDTDLLMACETAMYLGFQSLAVNFPLTVSAESGPAPGGDAVLVRLAPDEGAQVPGGAAFNGKTACRMENGSLTVSYGAEETVQERIAALHSFFLENRLDLAAGWRIPDEEAGVLLGEDFVFSSDSPGQALPYDLRGKKGLESLTEPGFFFADKDGDFLSDACDFTVELPPAPDFDWKLAVINFAARLGMDTTSYRPGLFTAAAGEPGRPDPGGVSGEAAAANGRRIRFVSGADCRISLADDTPGTEEIRIAGSGRQFLDFIVRFCNAFPLEADTATWPELLDELRKALILENGNGQLGMLHALAGAQDGPSGAGAAAERKAARSGQARISCFFSPDILEQKEALEKRYPQAEIHSWQEPVPVWEKKFSPVWEVDELREKLEACFAVPAKAGEQISILAAVSEPPGLRRRLEEEIRGRYLPAGGEVHILCAYKQGFSWLTELVAEKLTAALPLPQDACLHIAFAPFLRPGETEWVTADGTMPSYDNINSGDAGRWYDLPIRFLQETYPADDILSRQLGISRDRIVFELYQGSEDLTYEVTLCDAAGRALGERFTYRVPTVEQPYLKDFPELGLVHPATGYLTVCRDGEVCSERIMTDTERVWELYQTEVLPACRRYLEEKYGGRIDRSCQPLFARLVLDVSLSEPDERLGVREDLLSSLDSLHEEFYFAGLDYFKNYGLSTPAAEMLEAPGLIYPEIHMREGRPQFKAVLCEHIRQGACLEVVGGAAGAGSGSSAAAGEEPARPLVCSGLEKQPEVWMSDIGLTGGRFVYHIRISETDEFVRQAVSGMAALLEANALPLNERLLGGCRLVFEDAAGNRIAATDVPEKLPAAKDADPAGIPVWDGEVIGCGQYMESMRYLKRVPGIQVIKNGLSYEGRPVYAVDFVPRRDGYLSRTRRLTRNIGIHINARHHANEVSSTNAALRLIRKLLTEEKYADLSERINLVVVPMENTDGSAIHYGLQKEHPNWKLHIARFNALGKEFAHAVFEPDTIHLEARTTRRLWYTLLPDIQIDNHGVPSHEWEQQFSGYTPPSYQGFWLPRSLLYGYFWENLDPAYASSVRVSRQMEECIADEVNADGRQMAVNREWADRFEKYAHGWLPKLFPASYYRSLINYWNRMKPNPNYSYNSIRHPWITMANYVSEVPDETAQGDYLDLCADTHLAHDAALLDLFFLNRSAYDCAAGTDGTISYKRRRPLVLPGAPYRKQL